jgi:myo-inositol catabolism protein IolC
MTERLYILAFDHRRLLMSSLLGVEGEPDTEAVERAHAAKQLVWEGLERAIADGVRKDDAAALVDATYGLDVIDAARDAGVRVAVPLEASGRRELAFEHEDWRSRIERIDPSWAKVLLRYNPEGESEMNARQVARLDEVAAHCRATGRPLLIELLVPPEPNQTGPAFDAEIRPDLMVRAIEELRGSGAGADVWKVEGLERPEDCQRVAGATGGRCVVLGRGADRPAVDRWLRAAAAVDGFIGFAIGRSIWWDAARGFFDGGDRSDAVAAIAAEYRRCVDVYQAAAGDVGSG